MEKNVFGNYIINSNGNLFSIKRNRLMNGVITHKGYVRYKISYDGLHFYYSAHKLVAQAFIPNLENKPQINHINGIKTDNRVDNLEWCTQSENMIHRFSILGQRSSNLGKFGKDHHNSISIEQYTKDGEFIREWDSIADAYRYLGIDKSNIIKCCKGIYKQSGGFKWKYL